MHQSEQCSFSCSPIIVNFGPIFCFALMIWFLILKKGSIRMGFFSKGATWACMVFKSDLYILQSSQYFLKNFCLCRNYQCFTNLRRLQRMFNTSLSPTLFKYFCSWNHQASIYLFNVTIVEIFSKLTKETPGQRHLYL